MSTRYVFDMGRLGLMLATIIQGILFSAHVAQEHEDPRYYAGALIALPFLVMSWWYFTRPPSQPMHPPRFVWLVYSMTVVSFQVFTFGATDISSHDSVLLYTANILTPFLFLLCIVAGGEQCAKDAGFVLASVVAISNAFDVTDAIFAIAHNGDNVPAKYCGGFMTVACVLLVWSALEFIIRTQVVRNDVLSMGLHVIHIALNGSMLTLRAVMYAHGTIAFSVMIGKNGMVSIVRSAYLISLVRSRRRSPAQLPSPVIASAPPPPIEDSQRLTRPPTPLPTRFNPQDVAPNQERLYPSIEKHVHFEDDRNY